MVARAHAGPLMLMSAIVSGAFPAGGELHDALLLGLQKPNGGVRPITTGEIWTRLASLCALATQPNLGQFLARCSCAPACEAGPRRYACAAGGHGVGARDGDVTVDSERGYARRLQHCAPAGGR
jgi:hypothetical protein